MPQGRNLAINLVVRSKQAAKQLNQFETRTQRLGRALKVGLAAGAAIGGAAIARFAGQSVTAASDLEEAFSKAQQVFGDATGRVEKFADTAVTDLGLSKQAALEAVGTFGNLATSFGIGQGKAAEMSTTLTQLAADLASFNNTRVEDAINALRSGLSGETEPLKRYGIVLQDTRLRAEAAALGLEVTKGALDPLVKSQAAYSLILKDSANAQGDFARTQDGLANTQRVLTAAVEDAKAEIGQGLLGAVENTANAFGGAQGLAAVIEQNAYELGLLIKGIAQLVPENEKATETVDTQRDSLRRLGKLYNTAGGGLTGYGAALSVLILKNPKAVFTTNTLADAFKVVGEASDQSKAATEAWERVQRGAVNAPDHLTDSIYEQRNALASATGAFDAAAAAAAAYNAVGDKTQYFALAASLNRQAREARQARQETNNYGRSVGSVSTELTGAEKAVNRFREDLSVLGSELTSATTDVDAAVAAYESFASDVNSALGSGINLAAAFNGEQARKELEDAGQVSAETWINAFKAQLGSAEAAGEALDDLDAALRQPNGQLIAGAEALFQQILTVPTGLIPQVVTELIDSGLAPNLAGSLNHVFNGPVGTAWAETFRGEGVSAAQDILDGLDDSATALEGKFEALGKKVGKDIRKGIKAEINAVLNEIDALEGRISSARNGLRATGGRDFRARNVAGRRGAPVSEARAIAELLRNAERATGATP